MKLMINHPMINGASNKPLKGGGRSSWITLRGSRGFMAATMALMVMIPLQASAKNTLVDSSSMEEFVETPVKPVFIATPQQEAVVPTLIEAPKINPFAPVVENTAKNGERITFIEALRSGIEARQQGELHQAFNVLLQAYALAQTLLEKSQATGEIGIALLQSKRLPEAELWLTRAYNLAGTLPTPDTRYRYAIELGNVLMALNHPKLAINYYQEALMSKEPGIRLAARINTLRMESSPNFAKEWVSIEKDLALINDPRRMADYKLRLAKILLDSEEHQGMAFNYAHHAYDIAKANHLRRIEVGALDILSKIYEAQKRETESLTLTKEAIAIADGRVDQDLLINLEWRRGRFLERQQNIDEAILAYQKAVQYIEAIRFDIPVVYNDGRSSFRETLEPIYLGLANLLLKKATQPGIDPAPYLQSARASAEGIKQSELQDYLGDRCTVLSAQQAHQQLDEDTAVVYPIMFEDRLETLVETSRGINRYQSNVASFQLINMAKRFANNLRIGQLNIQAQSQALNEILLAPYASDLEKMGVKKIVVVPDGVLRLVPYAALYDGENYAIQKFAFSVSSALSLTHESNRDKVRPNLRLLIAGLENPGPVVEVLKAASKNGSFNAKALDGESDATCGSDDVGVGSNVRTRGLSEWKLSNLSCQLTERVSPIQTTLERPAGKQGDVTRGLDTDRLRASLQLPGVQAEVDSLQSASSAEVLLNQNFTLDNFSRALKSGAFNVVHIASHGVFGGSGDDSYLLSYDKLITMNALQGLLKSDNLVGNNIELLSLSACETADGDDRAPLGISGAALKARAKSALGTLWPVADEASKQVMIAFYQKFTQGKSKTESLRDAQLTLLKNPDTQAPFYWAPFILVGAWQ